MTSDWLGNDGDEDFEGHDPDSSEWLQYQPPAGGDIVSPGKADASAGEAVDAFIEALNTEGAARHLNTDVVPAGTSPVLTQQIIAMRQLPWKQRVFIRCLLQTAGSIRESLKLYNARFQVKLTYNLAQGWMRKSTFQACYASAREHVLSTAGLDPQGVLLKSQRVFEDAMTPAPILFKGQHTGYFEQDRANAMRAIEFQGRANGMLKEAETSRVTVQIVNLSSRKEAEADAEPEARVIDG